MRRSRLGPAVVGTALALAGCTAPGTGGAPDPSPTPSPEASPTPPAPVIERRALMSYPNQPTTAWTFTAGDSGVEAEGALTLVDPTVIVQTAEGFLPPIPIDAGDTLVMAVQGNGPATLVGIDADAGTATWTYAPAGGDLDNCVPDVIGSAIACAVTAPGDATDAVVVLIDAESGEEVGEIDLPGAPQKLAAGADLLVALTDPDPMTAEGEPHTYTVAAFSADGEEAWSTDVVYEPGLGRGPGQMVHVGESLTAVSISGSAYLLATDDGELLMHRGVAGDGPDEAHDWTWDARGDAVLLYDDLRRQEPEVIVVGVDGTELTTLAGHTTAPQLLEYTSATYLQDPTGQIVRVNPRTGAMSATGVMMGGRRAHSVSEIDGMLLVHSDSFLGFDLAEPGVAAWEKPIVAPSQLIDATTDGALLYAGGLSTATGASENALVYSALDLADGSVQWTLTVEPESEFGLATVARAGGRLVVVNGATMTALEP